WVVYEAVSDENALEGVKQACGTVLQPTLHLEKAAVLLTLDADLFGNDPDDVSSISGFAYGRRSAIDGGPMSRTWAVEAAHSLTGAMADPRLRLPSSAIPAFVAALAGRLAAAGVTGLRPPASTPSLPGLDAKWLDALAKDLAGHRGHGLVVAGAG